MIIANYEKAISIVLLACFMAGFAYAFVNALICVYHMKTVKSALERNQLERHGIKTQASPLLTKHEVNVHFLPGTPEYDIAMKHALALGRTGRGFVLCIAIFLLIAVLTTTGVI